MISTTIFPSRYIQGSGAIQRLGEEAKRLGESTLLIVDPYVFDHLLSDFRSSLTEALNVTFERFEGEASDEEVARLVEVANGANADVIIGIGGGKSLDTAKAVAHNMKAPVIIGVWLLCILGSCRERISV